MDIEWKCDGCGQDLITDSKYAGAKVECPKCKKPLVVPTNQSLEGEKKAFSAAEPPKKPAPTEEKAQSLSPCPPPAPESRPFLPVQQCPTPHEAIDQVFSLGPYFFTAFFDTQVAMMEVLEQLPYFRSSPPHGAVRKGTVCHVFGGTKAKDGATGFTVVTGGDLLPAEVQLTVDLFTKHGREQAFAIPKDKNR